MAPEMLTPLAVPEQAYPQGTLYVVVSHWATDGEFGSYEAPFTNLMDAQRQFHDDLKNELESGCVEKWRENSQFAEEETAESYECYLDGEYCENHFYLSIENGLCRWLLNLYAPWRQSMKMSAHERIFLIKLKLCRSIWL